MEAATMLITGIAFAAAQVGKKASDEAADTVWQSLKAAWKRLQGGDPAPAAITPSIAHELAADPDLAGAVGALRTESSLLRRLERNQDVVRGARLLWVDDHPEWNSWEISCLEGAGATVRTVETTRSALAQVADGYDLVVSDIAREHNTREGIDALPRLLKVAPETRVVFYVGALLTTGVPAGAFGITNRPDELLHLCMDVLERKRL